MIIHPLIARSRRKDKPIPFLETHLAMITDPILHKIVELELALLRIERQRSKYQALLDKLKLRTPEYRRAGNQSWTSRNRSYERVRCKLKTAWYAGRISREEYLAMKGEAYDKHRARQITASQGQ